MSKPTKKARRREELRRTLPRRTVEVRAMVQQPEFVSSAGILLGFLVVIAIVVIWSREQIRVDDGMIMTDTRLKRLDYVVVDEGRTDDARENEKERSPQVFALDTGALESLRQPLVNLPVIVSRQADFESIGAEVKAAYDLDSASVAALAPFASEGAPTQQWTGFVDELLSNTLPKRPILHNADWEAGMSHWTSPHLVGPDGPIDADFRLDAIALPTPPANTEASTGGDVKSAGAGASPDQRNVLVRALVDPVRKAGFPATVVRYVAAGIASKLPGPTYAVDEAATKELAERRAAQVPAISVEHQAGEIIYRRGDRLTTGQKEMLATEAKQFARLAPVTDRWLPRIGTIGFTIVVASFLVGYIVLFYPRIARNPLRLLAICALMTVMLVISTRVGVKFPQVMHLAVVAPTIFVAVLMLLAYDQRIALFLGATQCALATFALGEGIGLYVLLFAGCGLAVAQLREMRHRSALIQASLLTGIALALGAFLLGLIETPFVEGAMGQIRFQSFMAGLGGVGVGFVVLGLLPMLEKLFDMTTGMTLAELRDPKQPLLRQLQQKAPGTYNHSLQVANIAEAASEAIGANGLLVYVGALYHDIGKMNKPEYFVENQTDGASKHAKLSPAMSLLVIVGHVKDGIELAREYGLPRKLQHFIESHHGTTLVEYFYHAAKSQAEEDDRGTVQEIEFRYPGPKPRTKEAAILMLADAVESATRSIAEPTPSRIESLVRQLSRKRLTDGQYDKCDLQFRELEQIEESMIKSLCAIYHSRIAYPSQSEERPPAVAKQVSA